MKNISGQEWIQILAVLAVAGVALYRTINPSEPVINGPSQVGLRDKLIKSQRITTGIIALIAAGFAVYMFLKYKKA